MARRTYQTPIEDPRDREIRNLQEELHEACSFIISTTPQAFQDAVDSRYRCETAAQWAEWYNDVVEVAIGLAEPTRNYSGENRARCPLCKEVTRSLFTDEGFKVPDGLRKHLNGNGNAHLCAVMRALKNLVREARREARDREWQERKELEVGRRETEELYQVGPDEQRLFDEYIFGEARDLESLVWAEDRLMRLGFKRQVDGRVRAYVKVDGANTIYADPRQSGRISFSVYAPPAKRRQRTTRPTASFMMQDGWKNDFPAKFEQLYENALQRLC